MDLKLPSYWQVQVDEHVPTSDEYEPWFSK
ncbi:hypothetical protein BOH78_4668 [Pichia kudriavzevii]|uniref:Uncharacterized protein n=1 Tax=Pichia kudriavzevii TaxID=4909 RepID=A0A099NSC6_PICKU|nr:hypothetical protein JL09_g5205 [Pichia kudriavzevii]KGK35738.1 hypothetical protein JL09_g5112 [Pichia kudriavzevii]ONH71233.1 hypothetical protein BOH78_4668 [Pichia kudriavzevii]